MPACGPVVICALALEALGKTRRKFQSPISCARASTRHYTLSRRRRGDLTLYLYSTKRRAVETFQTLLHLLRAATNSRKTKDTPKKRSVPHAESLKCANPPQTSLCRRLHLRARISARTSPKSFLLSLGPRYLTR